MQKAESEIQSYFWSIVVDISRYRGKYIKYSVNLGILISSFHERVCESTNPLELQFEYGKDLRELLESEISIIDQSIEKKGIWLIDKIMD